MQQEVPAQAAQAAQAEQAEQAEQAAQAEGVALAEGVVLGLAHLRGTALLLSLDRHLDLAEGRTLLALCCTLSGARCYAAAGSTYLRIPN